MTELRNVEADARRFRLRVFVLGVVVLLAFLLIVARLLVLQVERHDDLAEHDQGKDAAAMPTVDAMPGRQRRQQRRRELEQANKAEIPGAACKVVHLPGNGDKKHLVGRRPGHPGIPETEEGALSAQFGKRD